MKFQNYFGTELQLFLENNRKENTVVFFKGFGRMQNQVVLSCPEALSPDGILNQDGTLNLPALEAKKDGLAAQLLAEQGFRVGLYEQLLAVLRADPDFFNRYSGEIRIAENNLFFDHYPAAISSEAVQKLYHYFQGETADIPEELAVYLNYYGDVASPDEAHYFTAPFNRYADEKLPVFPFFSAGESIQAKKLEKGKPLFVSSLDFLIQKADLLEDRLPEGFLYSVEAQADPKQHGFGAFVEILKALKIPYGIQRFQRFNISQKSSENEYLPLLQKYWGADASFRKLKFYSDPDSKNDTVEISQGKIISQIIAQSETALSGNRDFRNIFITAPTGAGKSLLFQLPALHLAEKSSAVTIVITPLIALMKDQVMQLEQEHHVTCATYINSTLSFEEREKRINAIHSGEKSIVYLAPELLVSMPLDSITGGRKVGLFVIDEAHIVTTWGKDFRADYWYLGDFLKKLKREGVWFPILCLTATAVYGGAEDVVNETTASLFLNDPLLYLGSVRRENIQFNIRQVSPKSVTGGVESFKVKKAAEAVKTYVERGEKSLVYCPFITQVDDIYLALDPAVRPKVKKYYGTLDKQTRDEAQASFRSGECLVMICTKAFGMGIDVKDICNVYHFAPTGSLADYVQEVGRAARQEGSQGSADSDFLPTDIRYVRTLNGISEIKQYQLREMLRKICTICQEKQKCSLFLSPDAFSYLFGTKDIENRVKNGLLLLSKDLEHLYGYPVLTIRPKAILTKGFVNVPLSAAEKFESVYGSAVHRLHDNGKRVLPSHNKRYESDTIVVNSGKVYELDMPAIWSEHFQDMSFSQFNRKFFSGELFQCTSGEIFSPRIHIRAAYGFPFPELKEKLKEYCSKISDIFRDYRKESKMFTVEDFRKKLAAAFGEDSDRLEFSGMLLNLFVGDMSKSIGFRSGSDRLKFIAPRKSPSGEYLYRVLNSGYITMPNYFVQLVSQCPPRDSNVFEAFIPLGHSSSRRPERLRLLSLLELLGLASYQVQGSQNMEIFVRINDPEKAASLVGEKYTNGVLTDIRRRHKVAQDIMLNFLMRSLTSTQRWDLIENYFLGREDTVRSMLKKPAEVESPAPEAD